MIYSLIGNNVSLLFLANHVFLHLKYKISLQPKAVEIIEKYKEISNNLLLPVISNQKMNAYLKEIADLCGITKTLTFHLARHTFVTTVTLTNGVSIESVCNVGT